MASFNSQSPSILLLSASAIIWLLYQVVQHIQTQRRRTAFKLDHGAKDVAVTLRPWDILGLADVYHLMNAAMNHRLLEYWTNNFNKYGKTYATRSLGRNTFMTADAENFKAIHATSFDEWAAEPIRYNFHRWLGRGVFTTDGVTWRHHRDVLRPQFEKRQVAEVQQFESHVQNLFRHIPADGQTVDLQELFHKLSIDSSSEFMTGTSTGLLNENPDSRGVEFSNAFETCCKDGMLEQRLGFMYHLMPHTAAKRAIQITHDYTDSWVKKAMVSKAKERSTSRSGSKGQYVFLNELLYDDRMDAEQIRISLLSILLAGRDTTAALLSALWFELARRPDVLEKLRAEVAELHGELPTYEKLRDMKYMKYCAQEALRLYPPAPVLAKVAARDTVLPRGGGSKGEDPLFCAKDDIIFYVHWSMMRSEEYYGKDVLEFKPERWTDPNLRPGWAYLPFGGGTRTCLGQQYALTEAYYVTARLLQEYGTVEPRNTGPWVEELTITLCGHEGTKVGLLK